MIEAIIKSLEPIFQGQIQPGDLKLDWVDKYGGLVETWTREAEGPEGVGNYLESFPVAAGTDPGCGSECLQFLSPDAGKKNVLFWTLLTDAVIAPVPANYSRAMKPKQYTQTARLNVWLNFEGCQNCDQSAFIAYVQRLHQVLDGKKFTLTAPLSLKGDMKATGAPSKDYKEIFGQWTFGADQKLFVWPFDFFALDFTFVWIQNQSCPILPTC